MTTDPPLAEFASREAMAAHLADLIESVIAKAVAEEGGASLALSGGSTPQALYRELSLRPLAWPKLDVTLVDERWVPPGDAGSNETFVRETLFGGGVRPREFCGFWSDAATPAAGAAVASARFGKIKSPLDAVVLGMGADGHTASWFPHASGLSGALSDGAAPVVHVRAQRSEITGPHVDRLTLGLEPVASARFICLLITGDEKRAVFEKAAQPGPVEDMPIRAILRARPDLFACWAP